MCLVIVGGCCRLLWVFFMLFCIFGLFKLSGLFSGSVRLSRLVWVLEVVFRLLGCTNCFR